MPIGRKPVVEFIGTFFLVFTVGMATAKTGAGDLAPLAIGSTLMVMVFAGGYISGGHFNSAVSTAVLMRGKMDQSEWVPYVVTQLLAGVVAGLLARAMNGHAAAAPTANVLKMLIVEFLFTFALCYVVLNVATAKGTEGNSFYGLAIGFTVVAAAFAVGGISGGGFNPDVSLGMMVYGLFKWSHIWVYWLAQFAAGPAAAMTFLYVQPAEKVEAVEAAG
jgi:aquaporin Z